MTEQLTLRLVAILAIGVASQWIAWRLRFPAILLLLAAGLAAGPGLGFIDPDQVFGQLLLPVVSLSVGVILFEGGLTLRLRELPAISGVVQRLVTLGALATWATTALGAWLLFDMSAGVAALLGAILVVTGPTVVGPLLEQVRPAGSVRAILKWEGIVIDPLGAMLAVFVFESISSGGRGFGLEAVSRVLLTLGLGTGLGVAAAALVVIALHRFWVPDSLQAPVVLVALLASQVGADRVQAESGLLAATIMGIALANQNYVAVARIVEFKENLRVLIIGGLFVALSARLTRDDISAVGFAGIAFLALVIFVARPLTVAVSTIPSKLSWRERAFLAGVAPRGIVAAAISSVFALQLSSEGHAGAHLLVPATFSVIIGTVILYGVGAAPLARRLRLSEPDPQGLLIVGAHPWARSLASALQSAGLRVLLIDSNWQNVSDARLDGLPCHHGSVLSDETLPSLDLVGIGNLLAVTPNDGINALAARRFQHSFGSANVFHLVPSTREPGSTEPIARELRGRSLFGAQFTFEEIQRRFDSGQVFKATPLTDQFGWDRYRERYPDPLLAATVDASGRITVNTGASDPTPGRTVIALVQDEPDVTGGSTTGGTAHT